MNGSLEDILVIIVPPRIDSFLVTIEKDTTLPNNKTYFQFSNSNFFWFSSYAN